VVFVTAALFLGVFTLRMLVEDAVDPYSMFYVLPVALAATAFGERAGILAALLALALMVVSTLLRHVTHSPAGWATRAVPIVLLGVLLGRATDRMREAEAQRRRLEQAALLHREAIEINDSLIQRMTAAKWALEAGHAEAALQALTEAVSEALQLVSGLIRRADMAERTEYMPDTLGGPASKGS
jgi:glucose-6-phosphate-specific signal transduction histidine kinase